MFLHCFCLISQCVVLSQHSIHKAEDFLFKDSFNLLSLIGSASAVACVQQRKRCTLLVQTQEQQQQKETETSEREEKERILLYK